MEDTHVSMRADVGGVSRSESRSEGAAGEEYKHRLVKQRERMEKSLCASTLSFNTWRQTCGAQAFEKGVLLPEHVAQETLRGRIDDGSRNAFGGSNFRCLWIDCCPSQV